MKRLIESGDVVGFREWRRRMERRNEDWRGVLLEAFGDAMPGMVGRLYLTVWPGKMVSAFKSAYGLDESVPLVADFAQWKHAGLYLPSDRIGGGYYTLYFHNLTGGEDAPACFDEWALGVEDFRLAYLYLFLAFPGEDASVGHVSIRGDVWRLESVRPRSDVSIRHLSMPLAMRTNAVEAIEWIRAHIR